MNLFKKNTGRSPGITSQINFIKFSINRLENNKINDFLAKRGLAKPICLRSKPRARSAPASEACMRGLQPRTPLPELGVTGTSRTLSS